MAVRETHTLTLTGDNITLDELANFIEKSKRAGATGDTKATIRGGYGDQRDYTPALITVTIT